MPIWRHLSLGKYGHSGSGRMLYNTFVFPSGSMRLIRRLYEAHFPPFDLSMEKPFIKLPIAWNNGKTQPYLPHKTLQRQSGLLLRGLESFQKPCQRHRARYLQALLPGRSFASRFFESSGLPFCSITEKFSRNTIIDNIFWVWIFAEISIRWNVSQQCLTYRIRMST